MEAIICKAKTEVYETKAKIKQNKLAFRFDEDLLALSKGKSGRSKTNSQNYN